MLDKVLPMAKKPPPGAGTGSRGLSRCLQHQHPVIQVWLLCFRSSALLMCLGKQRNVAQVLGSVPPMYQTRMKFLALPQPLRK